MKRSPTTVIAALFLTLSVLDPVAAVHADKATDEAAQKEIDSKIGMLEELVLYDGDFRVRVQAIFSLAKLKDPKVVAIIVKALKDKHPTVRAAAATALGNLGASEAVSALEKALEDPIDTVQDAAREALTEIMDDPKKLAALNAVPDVITDVPFHQVKVVFVVGPLKNKSGNNRPDLEDVFKRLMVERLLDADIDDSMIVTTKAVPEVVEQRLGKGQATGFFFTGTLVKLAGGWEEAETKRYVVDATVSLACMYYPEQNLAMTMQATASSSVQKVSYKKSIVAKLEEDAIGGAIGSLSSTLKTNFSKLTAPKDKGPKKKNKKKKK